MAPYAESGHLTDLTVAAMTGDRIAMNTLLACVRPRLYAYALRICKHNQAADDAIQDAFLHAYSHIHQLRQPSAFYPWIRSIVRRSAWRELRGGMSSLGFSDDAQFLSLPEEHPFEQCIEEGFERSYLHDAINHLSDTLKFPVLLRYFTSHQEYEDIAGILGIPVGTVRSRLNQAKKQLKELFRGGIDLPAALEREANQWNDFYRDVWSTIYDRSESRQRLLSHFVEDVTLHFTSGIRAQGRKLIEGEIQADLRYGSRSEPTSIFNLGDIGIVECVNANSAEYPDRCPTSTTFIFHRDRSKAVLLQLHHASRSLEAAVHLGA